MSAYSLCTIPGLNSDMVTLFKSLYNGMTVGFVLSCITSNTRGGGDRLHQRCPKSHAAAQLFGCRAPHV